MEHKLVFDGELSHVVGKFEFFNEDIPLLLQKGHTFTLSAMVAKDGELVVLSIGSTPAIRSE